MSSFYYRRSPRIIKDQGERQLEVFRPPSIPQPPTLNLISIMVPIIVTVAGSAAMMMFYKRAGNGSYVIVQMISLCTMVVSYFVPILVHLQQKGKHKRTIKKRNQSYDAHLNEQREKLQSWKNELILNWHQTHLEPLFCIQAMSERSSSIWDRIPQDFDFLKIRAGIGTVPSGFDITVPKREGIEKDPLVEKANELAERFSTIANAPALLDLNKYRVVGIVGNEEELQGFCRALVTQIATHHSPDEVKLAAFMSKMQTGEWDWLRWLPHIWDDKRSGRYLFQDGGYQTQVLEQLHSLLQRRSWMKEQEQTQALPFFVCLLPYIEMLEHEPILPLLMKDGDSIGATSIVLAAQRDLLPKECQLVVELHGDEAVMRSTNVTGGLAGAAYAKPKDEVPYVQSFKPDHMTSGEVDHFARQIAPYRVKTSSADEVANVLTLFDLYGIQKINELDIAGKWDKQRFPNTLPFPVGVRGGMKPVLLNLHDKIERKGHGPHGLMAGTTGSGKSEVIQSMIASLAVQYHPHDLALMLIDYKGGGMSNTFEDLPHVIATITNLEEEGLIERSKVSLKAELNRRQKLFVAAGNVQHIDEYYKTEWRTKEPLPHLFIVIDEFAQLKKDQPEFMSELVSIAAIGRTLGVHLLLATQKPGGIVDDKIWSNSRYRVCLRVQDEADSREMLKISDAAYITTPGRGYLQVGSNEVFELVQFAWSGAPYNPNKSVQQTSFTAYRLSLDGRRAKISNPLDEVSSGQKQEANNDFGIEEKQLSVLIRYIADHCQQAGIRRLPGPWLPPLPQYLTLDQIPETAEIGDKIIHPVVGLVDDVANQTQFPLKLDIESGNWIVHGMPGTGKTTFIQTLLYSLAGNCTPEDLHIYALDFGRMLKDYLLMPHTGDVLLDDEEEKLIRLVAFLEEELSNRKILFAEAGVKSRQAYCADTHHKLPAFLIIIDGYVSFKTQYETLHDKLEILFREGSGYGIYFMLTANRVSDIYDKIRSNFPNAVSFLLADAGDYHYAVGRLSKAPGQLPEGRGFVKGHLPPYEFQTALSLDAVNESTRAKQVKEHFHHMDANWQGTRPMPIRILPDTVYLEEVWEQETDDKKDSLTLGLQVSNLKSFLWSMEDGPYFTLGGRMESGKTSMLMTLGIMASRNFTPAELHLYLFDIRRSSPGLSSLKDLAHTQGFASDERTLEKIIGDLKLEIEKRAQAEASIPGLPRLMLLIDDADVMAKRISSNFALTEQLEYITRYGRENGVYIIAAGQANDMNQNWDAWLKEVKSAQVGWLLGTTDLNEAQLFNIKIPYDQSGKILPPGEGFYIKRKYERVKIAHAFAHGNERFVEQVHLVNSAWFESVSQS
ncbi:type VII secretion protein EssC [Paenibacillus sp. Marseille-P2973]|uniref:type VII secretion protein EssC n=1 Tax=Paenibacillus sp. Marseille-P2973 TaxID=1871032 RepID=UPI001B372D75|nr:type VII secretion protein EssC [Paenibacillus sp. Marseille-P2973]MBQ4900417.1 type VII secretion protein EssC [Paenibacillus sp. Marseille-P2973]